MLKRLKSRKVKNRERELNQEKEYVLGMLEDLNSKIYDVNYWMGHVYVELEKQNKILTRFQMPSWDGTLNDYYDPEIETKHYRNSGMKDIAINQDKLDRKLLQLCDLYDIFTEQNKMITRFGLKPIEYNAPPYYDYLHPDEGMDPCDFDYRLD